MRSAPDLVKSSLALPLLALGLQLLGCAHSSAERSLALPPADAPRAERQDFYQDHRLADPPGVTALRFCVDIWNCSCLDPCLPSLWRPPVLLGNGMKLQSLEDLAPLVANTPAGDSLELAEAADDSLVWFFVAGGGLFVSGVFLAVLPGGVESLGAGGAAGTFAVARTGLSALALLGAGASVVGFFGAHLLSYTSERTFYLLYNDSLKQALGLDRPDPAPRPAS